MARRGRVPVFDFGSAQNSWSMSVKKVSSIHPKDACGAGALRASEQRMREQTGHARGSLGRIKAKQVQASMS